MILLIGKNDSGKSSIMEAAYYMFQELSDRSELSSIMSRRTDAPYGGSENLVQIQNGITNSRICSFKSLRLRWTIELAEHGFVSSLSQMVRIPPGEGYSEFLEEDDVSRGFFIQLLIRKH